MSAVLTRSSIVEAARDWIGTPYRHQASLRGVGCDCLGLVRGVWRTLVGGEPETPGPYGSDWAEAAGEEGEGEAGGPAAPLPPGRRPALHARSLGFTHPATGEAVDFEVGAPPDFEAAADALRGL